MKVLFLMDSPEYLRFYDSVIDEFAGRGHQLALAVMSDRSRKPVGLGGFQSYANRAELLGVVPQHDGLWGDIAFGLRATMDFLRFLHPRFADASALRTRIKRKVLPRAYHWLDSIPRLSAGTVRALEAVLATAERAIPVCQPIEAFLREHSPDVLLVSPLVAAASEQVDWIKAAQARGLRTAVCIASWDNLTNKGLLRIRPDLVLVWNEAQKREAIEYHYMPEQRVAVTGAQLFDKWFGREPTRARQAFCSRVGLCDTQPFVLFVGSSGFISESTTEVEFVRRWISSLRSADEPLLRDVNVLVRPHPYNCHAWVSRPLADLERVAVFPEAGYNPVDAGHREDYFDSLFHSAAVVGINTSAMIEASIVGRPVLSILAGEFATTQEGTIHFHYLSPEHGGCVAIADSLDAHVDQLADRLRRPEAFREQIGRFVADFVRPQGTHRPSTPLFVEAVERLAAQPAPRPSVAGIWRWAVRPAILIAAAPAGIVRWAAQPSTQKLLRKQAPALVRRAQKGARKAFANTHKRALRATKAGGKRWRRWISKNQRVRAG